VALPLFDSLTHPTPTGEWLQFVRSQGSADPLAPAGPGGVWQSCAWPEPNTVQSLLEGMDGNRVQWAFAMGMKNIGGYRFDGYAQAILPPAAQGRIFPVAFLDFSEFSETRQMDGWLAEVRPRGYYGIKIHPRLSGIDLGHPDVSHAMAKAGELGIPVFLCSYFYDVDLCGKDCMTELGRLLASAPRAKVVLLHGGLTRLLEMMHLVKVFPNTLLDLSYTLCQFEGSSVDLDIAYLFRRFDQRICIGSDSPGFSHACLRRRFDYFSGGVDRNKLENIAYKNIVRFTGLEISL